MMAKNQSQKGFEFMSESSDLCFVKLSSFLGIMLFRGFIKSFNRPGSCKKQMT